MINRIVSIYSIILITCLFMLTPGYCSDAENAVNDSSGETAQIFSLYEDVNLVSTLKFYSDTPSIRVKAVFPQLESDRDNDHDSDGIDGFNESVLKIIDTARSDFKNQVTMMQNSQSQKSSKNNHLNIDYNSAIIQSGKNNHIISVRFTIEESIVGMAHPTHRHEVLNYDLDHDQLLELGDLFLPHANYLEFLSLYCAKALMKKIPANYIDKEMVTNGTTAQLHSFKNWNIKPNGLLITFDEATVAPYVIGAQTVLVPFTAMKKIISPTGPIGLCALNRKKCGQNNTLTGGFIDEA